MPVTCTLVADGSSDRVLIPLLEMLLDEHCLGPRRPTHFVELPAGLPLIDRIQQALDLYPCDLLFVHRDAEKAASTARAAEIRHALAAFAQCPPTVLVIPVRMTESWLLVDEKAIRAASDRMDHLDQLRHLPSFQHLEHQIQQHFTA